MQRHNLAQHTQEFTQMHMRYMAEFVRSMSLGETAPKSLWLPGASCSSSEDQGAAGPPPPGGGWLSDSDTRSHCETPHPLVFFPLFGVGGAERSVAAIHLPRPRSVRREREHRRKELRGGVHRTASLLCPAESRMTF